MEESKKKISVRVPTYNEEENVEEMTKAIVEQFENYLPSYDYEILFIDNCSTDHTREKLTSLCEENPKIKAIFNARNFGQFNSPYYGLCQATGDCAISIAADFQEPVKMIPVFVKKWEEGAKIVCGIREEDTANPILRGFRRLYYKLIGKFSTVKQIESFNGFGLYDKSFLDVMRSIDDPAPFLRGIVAELGFQCVTVSYKQEKRREGKSSNNFFRLYDAAMQSFSTYSKTPVRFITFFGLFFTALSILGGIACIILACSKVNIYNFWLIPLISFGFAVTQFFMGIIGEYILTIKTQVIKRPIVVEEKRINFEEKDDKKE